jgi:hypothetical protein
MSQQHIDPLLAKLDVKEGQASELAAGGKNLPQVLWLHSNFLTPNLKLL